MDRLERIENKVDKIDCKLDQLLERVVRTEEMAQSNRGLIKILITGTVSVIIAAGSFIAKQLWGM